MTPYARPYVRPWQLTTLRKALRKGFLKINVTLHKALCKALCKCKVGRDLTPLHITEHLSNYHAPLKALVAHCATTMGLLVDSSSPRIHVLLRTPPQLWTLVEKKLDFF
jgi:hypothetical protein